MDKPRTTPSSDQTARDPERPDDFTGPPVTAAEMAMLEQLAQTSAALAMKAAARIEALLAEPIPAEPETAKAAAESLHKEMREFDRLSRNCRLTLGLKLRLATGLEKWRRNRDEASSDAAGSGAPARDRSGWAAKQHAAGAIIEEITRATQGDKQAGTALRRTRRWFAERDHEAQLPNLPLGELIARIARDFGHQIDWSQWQDRDWAADAAQTFPPRPRRIIQHLFTSEVVLPDGTTKKVETGRTMVGQTIARASAIYPKSVMYREYRSAGAGAVIELPDGTRLRLQVGRGVDGEMEWYGEDPDTEPTAPPSPAPTEPAPTEPAPSPVATAPPGADPPRRDRDTLRNYSIFDHL